MPLSQDSQRPEFPYPFLPVVRQAYETDRAFAIRVLRCELRDQIDAATSVSGTFRTSRDVRLESGMRSKAEIRRPTQIHRLTP